MQRIIRHLVVFLVALSLWQSALAAPHQLIKEPVITCINEKIELRLEKGVVDIPDLVTFDARLYHIDGHSYFPGPVLQMKQGTWCAIEITNALASAPCDYHSNSFHCPDTTNLHTHGLHISSAGKQDNIAVKILTGQSHVYNYTILPEHLMGTFWYHSHSHGAAMLQIMGGLHGVIDLLPSDSFHSAMPSVVQDLYDAAEILVLSHIHFGGNDHKAGLVSNASDPMNMLDYLGAEKEYRTEELTFQANPRGANPKANAYVVNGQYQPVIDIAFGSPRLFRVLHAGGLRTLELSLNHTSETQEPDKCRMQVVARDGVFQYAPWPFVETLVMFPGSRVDVAIRCPNNAYGDIVVLQARPQSQLDAGLSMHNRHSQGVILTFNVTLFPDLTNNAADNEFPSEEHQQEINDLFPSYLQTTMKGEAKGKLTFALSERERDDVALINGHPFSGFGADLEYLATLCLNEVYEFTLTGPPKFANASSSSSSSSGMEEHPFHPFHAHVNHMQVYDIPDDMQTDNDEILRKGEWRDVMPLYAPIEVKVRYPTNHFAGDVMVHCHVLEHEDTGMMGVMNVVECIDGVEDDLSGIPDGPPTSSGCLAVGTAHVWILFLLSSSLLLLFLL